MASSTLYFLTAVVAFGAGYAGVAATRVLALRRGVLDVPNQRSSHAAPVPRGGGLPIVLLTLGGFLAWTMVSPLPDARTAWGYLAGGGLVAAVGLADDIRSLSARLRMAIHILAACALVGSGAWCHHFFLPWVGRIELGWLGLPLTLLWIVGLVNAFNLMDGIDGIAGGQAVVAAAFWLVVPLVSGGTSVGVLASLTMGASLAFLAHNLSAKRIFMGDVGSTFLGYTLAAMPILASRGSSEERLWGYGLLAVAPFVWDAGMTFVRRVRRGDNVFAAHREHVYQRLTLRRYSHRQVSAAYSVLATCSGLVGVAYLVGSDSVAGSLLLAEGAGWAWLTWWFFRPGGFGSQAGSPAKSRLA